MKDKTKREREGKRKERDRNGRKREREGKQTTLPRKRPLWVLGGGVFAAWKGELAGDCPAVQVE